MNAAPQIGWVGLGSMGSRMAPNLVNNGYAVTGFDLDRGRAAACGRARTQEGPVAAGACVCKRCAVFHDFGR